MIQCNLSCGRKEEIRWDSQVSQHEGPEPPEPQSDLPVAIHATQVFIESPRHVEANRMGKRR